MPLLVSADGDLEIHFVIITSIVISIILYLEIFYITVIAMSISIILLYI